MVLCPFIYLMMRYDTPPLDLQPAEVQSAHWVPLHSLCSPVLRTFERANISDRAVRQRGPAMSWLVRLLAGQMLFTAVRLQPSESLFCNVVSRSIPPVDTQRPLLLWGLTLGITADLVEHFDSDASTGLWSWPTISHWDIRFFVWALTHSFRSQRLRWLKVSKEPETVANSAIGGVDAATYTTSLPGRGKASKSGVASAHLLDGYFERMKRAVMVAFGVRLTLGMYLLFLGLRRYYKRNV